MANEEELRLHRCCFTRHRPEKLHQSEEAVKEELTTAIQQAIADGYVTLSPAWLMALIYGLLK